MVHTAELESVLDRPWSALVRAYFQRYPNPYASHVVQVDIIDRQLVPASHPRLQWPPSPPNNEPGSASAPPPAPARAPPSQPGEDDHLVLRTSRLILKRGTLPSWAPRGVIKSTESWVLEETEVDIEPPAPRPSEAGTSHDAQAEPTRTRCMRVWTRNLDHVNVLAVTEGLTFVEPPPPHAGGDNSQLPPAGAGEDPRAHPSTLLLTRGHVASSLGFGLLRGRVEKFGLKRFRAHADTSRAGLVWAADADLGGGRVATAVRRFLWRFRQPAAQPAAHDLDEAGADDDDKWRTKLRAALRPPFLDGYPPTPLQRVRNWVWGDEGRVAQAREAEERIRWAYKARQLLGLGPWEAWAPSSREGGRGYSPLWARLRRLPRTEEQDPDHPRQEPAGADRHSGTHAGTHEPRPSATPVSSP